MLLVVLSMSVVRGLEKFHQILSSRVRVMAPHCPQRGMNIGTRFRHSQLFSLRFAPAGRSTMEKTVEVGTSGKPYISA